MPTIPPDATLLNLAAALVFNYFFLRKYGFQLRIFFWCMIISSKRMRRFSAKLMFHKGGEGSFVLGDSFPFLIKKGIPSCRLFVWELVPLHKSSILPTQSKLETVRYCIQTYIHVIRFAGDSAKFCTCMHCRECNGDTCLKIKYVDSRVNVVNVHI